MLENLTSYHFLSRVDGPPSHYTGDHRRVLLVLHYPRNMVIYHYPLIGVIYVVSLHIIIIKNYPNLFSNYYPKYTIWVNYPFILNAGEFIYKVTLPEHYLIVR